MISPIRAAAALPALLALLALLSPARGTPLVDTGFVIVSPTTAARFETTTEAVVVPTVMSQTAAAAAVGALDADQIQATPTAPPRDMRTIAYDPFVTPPADQEELLAELGYRQITYYSCHTWPTTVRCGWHMPLIPLESGARGSFRMAPAQVVTTVVLTWAAATVVLMLFA